MAVYKRNYQPYDGPITDARWRFTILPRYAFQQTFDSKAFTGFFSLCFMPALVGMVIIYLHHNVTALLAFNLDAVKDLIPIDNRFFMTILDVQTTLTFFIAAFVGPGLISPDLTNNALPLYLSRPLTRKEYVLGKLCVIVTLTSLITWIPGLLLFFLQTSLAGAGWAWEHMRIAAAIVLASWMWILVISLMALALSAWVKWRPIAGAAMFGVFFAAAAFGETTNDILFRHSPDKWGTLLQLPALMNTISHWLFEVRFVNPIPVWSAWLAMFGICGLSLLLLARKIRACEVVRG